jgi:hypothetical protein
MKKSTVAALAAALFVSGWLVHSTGDAVTLAVKARSVSVAPISDLDARRDTILNASVRVELYTDQGKLAGTGSATALNAKQFLTNQHVAQEVGKTLTLRGWVREGKHTFPVSYQAKVKAIDADLDLALVELTDDEWSGSTASLASVDAPLLAGEDVLVAGAALSTRPHITQGLVSLVGHSIQALSGGPHIVTSATLLPGNSGGGLWAKRSGKWVLVGVPRAVALVPMGFGASLVSSHNYSIPLDRVRRFLKGQGVEA